MTQDASRSVHYGDELDDATNADDEHDGEPDAEADVELDNEIDADTWR